MASLITEHAENNRQDIIAQVGPFIFAWLSAVPLGVVVEVNPILVPRPTVAPYTVCNSAIFCFTTVNEPGLR